MDSNFSIAIMTYNLISLSHAPVILDIHSWVTPPWHSIDQVAGASLTGFPEVLVANPSQVVKPNALRIAMKHLKDF